MTAGERAPQTTDADAKETAPIEGTVAAPPQDPRQLEQEIERTREQLGQTVQELVARVDVKSRAQAKANEISGRVKSQAVQARQKAWDATPEQVRRVVTKGAQRGPDFWMPIAAAAGVLAVGFTALWEWTRRTS